MDIPPNLTSLAKSRKKKAVMDSSRIKAYHNFLFALFTLNEHCKCSNMSILDGEIWKVFLVKNKFWLFASLSTETKDTQANYSMLSIKRLVLLNVLIWIFPKKSLLNDLVYFKFWELQYIENEWSLDFLKTSLINNQSISNFRRSYNRVHKVTLLEFEFSPNSKPKSFKFWQTFYRSFNIKAKGIFLTLLLNCDIWLPNNSCSSIIMIFGTLQSVGIKKKKSWATCRLTPLTNTKSQFIE